MRKVALVLVALVALLHVYFLVLEMFLWRTRARRIFRMSAEQAEATARLAVIEAKHVAGNPRQPGAAGEFVSDIVPHALDRLGAHRLGHGVRCVEDDDLLRRIVRDEVMLEVCPTSNVHTGAAASIEQHPITALWRAGLSVGVNTDNRLMSGVTLTSELLAVATAFELSWIEIGTLVANAANSAFAPYEQRRRLVDEVIRPAFT